MKLVLKFSFDKEIKDKRLMLQKKLASAQ